MCAFGTAGAITFGLWGAALGAAIGNVADDVRQRYYSTNDCSSELYEAYSFLGISVNATNEDVEKAYREKSRLYHPDREGDSNLQSKLNSYVSLIRNSRKDSSNQDAFVIV